MTNDFDDLTEEDVESIVPGKGESSVPAAAAAEMEKLSEALDRKAKEAAEAHDRYLRTYADFENYRKRMQRGDRLFAEKQLLWEGEAFLAKPCTPKAVLEGVALLLSGHTKAVH